MKVCYKYIGVRLPDATIPIEDFIISEVIPFPLRQRALNALLNGLQRGYIRG